MTSHLVTVLRNGRLRRVQLACFGSSVGDWAYLTAVSVWAYGQGGAAAVGAFQAARFVLVASVGPVGGLLADRLGHRRVMLAADALRFVLVGAAAVLLTTDVPAAAVYALALAAAAVGATFRPSVAGLVPRLVESRELAAANGVATNLETVASFAGPALGGVLAGWVGVPAVFWLNVATYALSFLLVAGVRTAATARDTAAPALDPAGFVRETTRGFTVLARSRDLRSVAGLAAGQGLLWGALTVMAVVLAARELGTGPSGAGYLTSIASAGTIVGGLVLLARSRGERIGRGMALAVAGWGAAFILISAAPGPVALVVALATIGLCDPWVNVGLDTLPQRLAPEDAISRVWAAVDCMLIAAMALGALVTPLLVHELGLRPALAALGILVALGAVISVRRMGDLDRRLSTTDAPTEEVVAAQAAEEPVVVGDADATLGLVV